MKPLLTTLLIFIFGLQGIGQNELKLPTDSNYRSKLGHNQWDTVDTKKLARYTGGDDGGELYIGRATPTTDTIKVLLLYCDTSLHKLFEGQAPTYWSRGYEVLSYAYNEFYNSRTRMHVSYLDRNKLPLRKSVVVWMVKEIK